MLVHSTVTGKSYENDNSQVLYISNTQQVFKYLSNGAEADLLDIIWTNTKNNCLVFVFKRTQLMQDLYKRWQDHEL